MLRFKDSKDKLIRRAVITLLPRMAAFSPERFAVEWVRGTRASMGGHQGLPLLGHAHAHECGCACVWMRDVRRHE